MHEHSVLNLHICIISIVLHFTTEDKFVLVVSFLCLWQFRSVKSIPLNFMFSSDGHMVDFSLVSEILV